MKTPELLSAAGIETADISRWTLGLAIADPTPRDHHVSAHRDGRGEAVAKIGESLGHPPSEVQHPALGEFGIGLAGRDVHREQPGHLIGQEKPPLFTVAPVGEPPTGVEADPSRLVEFRVEHPEPISRLWVEREQSVEWSAHIHHAADHQRSGLEGRKRAKLGAVAEVTRIMLPGNLEPGDVFLGDLLERGVAAPAGITSDVGPLLGMNRQYEQEKGTKSGRKYFTGQGHLKIESSTK